MVFNWESKLCWSVNCILKRIRVESVNNYKYSIVTLTSKPAFEFSSGYASAQTNVISDGKYTSAKPACVNDVVKYMACDGSQVWEFREFGSLKGVKYYLQNNL